MVQPLFVEVLGLADASAYDIFEQLDVNAGKLHEISNTKALLIALSSLISGEEALDEITLVHLQRIEIFPARQLDGNIALATAADETWFFADNHRHQKTFQGKVALLDFSIEDVSVLMPLFKLLEISQRSLSRSVVDEMVFKGTSKVHPELTAMLQSKAKYIVLYAFLPLTPYMV